MKLSRKRKKKYLNYKNDERERKKSQEGQQTD